MSCVALKCTGGLASTITRGSRTASKRLSGLESLVLTSRSIFVTKHNFSEKGFSLPFTFALTPKPG